MSETPILGLPLIAAAQAQKHVTHNEAIDLIDRLMLLTLRSRTLTTPPADAAPSDRFAVASGASGAWAGHAGQLAVAETGGWSFITPKAGWLAFVSDEATLAVFVDGAWVEQRRLGIGTRPDAINQFAAALTAALFTDLGAGLQIKVNKSTVGSTASHLFQSSWSGRAEFGLIGGDDFELKVSPDGGSWKRVFRVDRTSGLASFDGGAARASCDVLTTSGAWTKPDWARLVTICAIGGGGGGGAGRTGAAGSLRYGGGGGGGGGMIVEQFLASELGASIACTVGTGGAGAATNAASSSNGGNGSAGLPSYAVSSGIELLRALGGEGGLGGTTSAGVGGNGGTGNDGAGNVGGAGNGAYGLPNIASMLGAAALSGGGGGGGYLDAANAAISGGAGGIGGRGHGDTRRATGGTGGASGIAGTTGGDKTWTRGLGAGGGGGGSAAAGGAGGAPGGGGGGGGGATNGTSAGAGGAGGRGEIRIICIG